LYSPGSNTVKWEYAKGENIEKLYYVCYNNFSIFSPFAYSHLTVLPPGEYKLLINSALTNATVYLPLNVSVPLGDYVFVKNNTIYAILPPNVSQVEINGITSKVVLLGNFTYEVVNSQEILNSLGTFTTMIPMEINVWINGKEYNLYVIGISYAPRLVIGYTSLGAYDIPITDDKPCLFNF
jgi:hypothetical protein